MNKNAYCSKYRNKDTDKIRQKDKERKKFEREHGKFCDEKKQEEKRRKNRERKRLAKKRKLEQIDQLSPTPTREETEASTNRSMRRADNALPSIPRKKKEIVTSLAKK